MDPINSSRSKSIQIVLDASDIRVWHNALIHRLRSGGFFVGVQFTSPAPRRRHLLDPVLHFEAHRFGRSLASRDGAPSETILDRSDLVIDLAGRAENATAPTLQLLFNGQAAFANSVADLLATGSLPTLNTSLDGVGVGVARPMLSDRLWMSRICEELLAGALSLIEQSVARFFSASLVPVPIQAFPPASTEFWRHYWPNTAKEIVRRAQARLQRSRPFYWQVAYRLTGDAEALGVSSGALFTVLPDDGQRFYADPFVLGHEGRTYLFVEEYPYAKGKGVISVAELGSDNRFGEPRPVLEEPYHLSYPQVFCHGGNIFMLPESGGARRLVLYRAQNFPHDWVVDTVLFDDMDINDATLLEHEDFFWLFGTERRGPGSASDTLVVFSALSIRGPWTPHKLNPIAIDRSAARPGGAFIRRSGQLFLPVQDGQRLYGGSLGLMEILRLDHDEVILAPPLPLEPAPAWNRSGIHTLNRAGTVEVVDSCG